MIWLNYRDERERAQTLIAMARGCQWLDSRLCFLSSEEICESTREAVWQIEASPLPELTFRSIKFPVDGEASEQAWADTIEIIKTALIETSGVGSPIVAWVESPLLAHSGTRELALRDYHEALTALAPKAVTIVNAFRLADAPAQALFTILESSNALVSAKMLLPRCPVWLLSPAKNELGPAAPTAPADHGAESIFTPFAADKLAAIGQIGAGFAHELGNPLSIISSSLQYLYQRLAANNDPASDFAMAALLNVERMHGILQSMLDSAGSKKPHFELIDLKEEVSEVLRFTSGEFAQRGIAAEVSFDPGLPRVWGDPFGVKQILLNLVKNALDAISEGGGGNTIRLCTRLDAKGRAVVEVENNGAVIQANVLPNLFRPFYTTRNGGTGLGLYLSRQIAKGHDGELSAENLVGGVRFTLTLPLDLRKEEERGQRPDRR